jgi:catechol 2,3-dioxygenase-like lactoylglutathione lyase family enzyme
MAAGKHPVGSISAVTLTVSNMARSIRFYTSLGFEVVHGGSGSGFSSLRVGEQFLNLMFEPGPSSPARWGRVIFHVGDVDEMYRIALNAGHRPETAPRNAGWGERYFHLDDPDGHNLSFAKPL